MAARTRYYFPEDGEREAWERPGPYTGRGPQGYRRSKESIHEEICENMTRHGWLDASEITITVDDQNEVTLEGTVESRRAKRLAEDLAEDVRGVQDVHNRLRVQRQDPS
ncbi:MAG: BON domain-containing protein [Chloroflexi bacterium]|nr:BON domain-containing protein [Chloroflexota bacterium]